MKIVAIALLLTLPAHAAQPKKTVNVDELIRKSEAQTRGKSLEAEVTMKVIDGSDERSISFRTWTQGTDKATVKVLQPPKDRNTGNLRLGLKLWQFLPNVDRLITIPPSMMLQSWMGSDFTNDDLVKSSSLSKDYTHKLLGGDSLNGENAYKILCTPKPTAPVVWGKIIEWLRYPDAVPLKREFYSERGDLLKTMTGTDIKTFGKHTVPTTLTMVNHKKNGAKTVLHYDKITYDEPVDAAIFRQEFLRKAVKD